MSSPAVPVQPEVREVVCFCVPVSRGPSAKKPAVVLLLPRREFHGNAGSSSSETSGVLVPLASCLRPGWVLVQPRVLDMVGFLSHHAGSSCVLVQPMAPTHPMYISGCKRSPPIYSQ